MNRLSIAAAFLVATLTVSMTAWAIGGAIGGGGGGGSGALAAAVRAASIGDSISTYPVATQEWPMKYSDLAGNERLSIERLATSGHTASQIRTVQWPIVDNGGYSVLFVNGGTNECFSSTNGTDALTYAASAQSDLQAVVTDAAAQGIRVVLMNIPPAEGSAGFSSFIQTCIDTYNANHLAMTGVHCFVDAYAALDTDDDDAIDAAYDVGDHIHPNSAGTDALAAAVESACGYYGSDPGGSSTAMLSNGTIESPSLAFASNTDSGWYYLDSAGVHNVGLSIDGSSSLISNQYGLGIGAATSSGMPLYVYGYAPGGSSVVYFRNVATSGVENLYIGEDIASTYNHGSVLWHGSTAAVYTGWAASQFGLRTGASGGMMLDSYNAGPIKARVNAVDVLNITSTVFETGGAIAASGTVKSFRTPGAAANSGVTLPTCDASIQFHQFAVDDTNDTASAMLCWCRRGTDDSTYAWVSIHDNSTACIDP